MSKYNSNYIIALNIKIDDLSETICVLNTQFERIIKADKQVEKIISYDLSIIDHSCESIGTVCNYIGDLFNNVNSYEEVGNDYIYFLKFVDEHVLSNCVDKKKIKQYLSVVKFTTLPIYKFFGHPAASYVPGTNKNGFTLDNRGEVKCTYIPNGDMSDVYYLYSLMSYGRYTNIQHVKWFRTIACLVNYYGLDDVICFYRYAKSDIPAGTYEATTEELPISTETDFIDTKRRMRLVFGFDAIYNRFAIMVLKSFIENDPNFIINPATKMLENIIRFQQDTSI